MSEIVNQLAEWLELYGQTRLLFASIVLLLFLLLLRAWRLKKEEINNILKPAGRAAASGICSWIWSKLCGLVRALDYLSTRREWRYEQPWWLLLGQPLSGKSSLLQSVSISFHHTPPLKAAQLQATGIAWFFLRNGVVIDLDSKRSNIQAKSFEENAWSDTLSELSSLRPERPLDGIAVCVSADTLLQANREERDRLADNIHQQLNSLQERLEFALPLTIIVTQCDRVDGFCAFWRSQDVSRQAELFGYSASSQTQASPPGEWTDQAFVSLKERLHLLQVETASKSEQIDDADGFFLFPENFNLLHDPLRIFLENIFRASAWQAGYLYRGLYFTGSLEAKGEIREGIRKDVAFVDSLMSTRMLAESGLAKPTRKGIFSRNKLIRFMQFSTIALALVLFGALYFVSNHLSHQLSGLKTAQEQLQQISSLSVPEGTCVQKDTVYALLSNVAMIDQQMHYLAIPVSWLDQRVEELSDKSIEDGVIDKVLMPTMKCYLNIRSQKILTFYSNYTSKNDFLSLQDNYIGYLNTIRELEDNIALYNKLAELGGNLSQKDLLVTLASLSKYLFESELPAKVMHEKGALSGGFRKNASYEKFYLTPEIHERLTQQIRQIGVKLRRQLHQEVGKGNQLLADIDANKNTVKNLREFSDWMIWIEKSWLFSTPENNPCEAIKNASEHSLQTLIKTYSYPDNLNHELVYLGKKECYLPAMDALTKMQLSPYGRFFYPRKPFGLEVADTLKSALIGLPELMQLSFSHQTKPKRFSCLPNSEGFRQIELAEAMTYMKEYETFLEKIKTKGGEIKPLAERMARHFLSNALNDALQRSQIVNTYENYPQTNLEAVNLTDRRLYARSQELTASLDDLLSILHRYSGYGDPVTTPILWQCARDFASDNLLHVGSLVEASRLYTPIAALSGDYMYDLGSLPMQKDYLSRQVARAQVLVSYAVPFMTLLSGTPGMPEGRDDLARSVEFWKNSVEELNRYTQGKEPQGQVTYLDDYFIKLLGEINYPNCSEQLTAYESPSFNNDLFSERRRPLELLVQLRCENRQEAQAVEAYAAWARRFNRELSGSFPFAEITAHDANITVVRKFFTDYLVQRPVLEEALKPLKTKDWREIHQFISEMDEVAEFFRTNLVAGDKGNGNSIHLQLAFNVPHKSASGGEQIVSWLLSDGSQAAGLPNRDSVLNWQAGDHLKLDLTWAAQSFWRPQSDIKQRDLRIEGNDASFQADQPWGLLRLLKQHTVDDASGNVRGQMLLRFVVPQLYESNSGKYESGAANLYMGMTLLGTDPKTQAEIRLRLPKAFPKVAPTVD